MRGNLENNMILKTGSSRAPSVQERATSVDYLKIYMWII